MRARLAQAELCFLKVKTKRDIPRFTENYVKVNAPWNPDLVNTLHQIVLSKIDDDGLVRFEFSSKPAVIQA